MFRRALCLVASLAGLALLLFDARWLDEWPLRFECRWAGRVLWAGDRAAFAERVGELRPVAFALALLAAGTAFGVGLRTARQLGASTVRSRVAGIGFALVLVPALLPGVAEFVVERGAESARHYLELGDLAHGLGWGLLGLSALAAFAGRRSDARAVGESEDPEHETSGLNVLLACVVAAVAPALASHVALDGDPVTNDGAAYLYQAEVFADGALTREIGDLAPFFPARQIVPGPRAFSKYPPGHSAVLAVGALVGVPELLPRLLAGLVPLLTFLLARRLRAPRPELAAWLVAISPAVLGVQVLWLSHSTSLPFALAFALAAVAAGDALEQGARSRARALALAGGFALSVAFLARPLTAAAFALPFVVRWLVPAAPGRRPVVLLAGLGALPGAAAFLWINHALTGSAWRTAYALYAELVSPNDRWGLANLPTAGSFTGFNLARAILWTHGALPGLWLAVLGGVAAARPRQVHLLWTPSVSLLGFYALHRFHGVPWAGPLYLVEAVPLLAILSASGLALVAQRAGRVVPLVVATLVLASAQLLGPHFALARVETAARRAPRDVAARAGLSRAGAAVVFVVLDDEASRKRYPLPPPANVGDATQVLFAADLGPRNDTLLARIPGVSAWRFTPATGELERLEK